MYALFMIKGNTSHRIPILHVDPISINIAILIHPLHKGTKKPKNNVVHENPVGHLTVNPFFSNTFIFKPPLFGYTILSEHFIKTLELFYNYCSSWFYSL